MPELGIGLGISKGAAPKTKLLVDKYNIDAAFSLRKVRAEYNGPCVRVRNSSGDLADIGFTNQGVLDEDALNAHCGDNDGTVQTWYNQSTEGGRFNAVQNTVAAQPVIYDASEGGYLGYINTNQGGQPQAFDLENIVPSCPSIFAVYQMQSDSGNNNYLVSGSQQGITHRDVYNETGVTWYEADTQPYLALYNDGVDYDKKYLLAGYAGGATNFLTLNGYVAASDTDAAVDGISVNALMGRGGGARFRGRVWEIFLSTSDLSANRIAIENSILAANGLTVPEKTLLEKYGSGAVAYSFRSVNREYVGPIISLDCATDTPTLENPIYLTSEGKINVQRITDLCTNPDTTTSNGYVRVWYDQSGQGIDASSTVSNAVKPAIFIGGTGIVLSNGEPAMLFNDFDTVLSTGTIPNNSGTSFVVYSPKEYANTDSTHMFARGLDFSDWYLTANNGDTSGLVLNPAMTEGVTTVRISGYETITTPSTGRDTLYDGTFGKQSLVFVDGWANADQSWGISNYSTTGGYDIEGYVQEWIWWEDSIKDSIDSIESSVNNHYLIYQEVDTTSGFVSNSAYNVKLAHSVRKLSDSLLCCKIERSSDNATKNIGWGSDGFVDTQAIIDFCGSSSGKVLTVYDQSGQGYHAYADTSLSNFLWIYDGTDIYTSNGRPAFYQKDASTAATYRYSNSGAYSVLNEDAYSYTAQTKASYSVVAGPMTQNADSTANGQDYLITTGDMTVYRDSNQRLRVDIFDSGEAIITPITTADAASSQRVIMAGGTLGGTVWGHIDDSEYNNGVDNPEGWYGVVDTHRINIFFSVSSEQADNPYLQETIFYDNDFRAEGTLESLKTEINDAFDVFASDETPTSGFLSEFSGAAAAYSVRKLGDSPVCMRVRKRVSLTDYFQVIGFDANGDLDTAAIEEFGGSDDVFVQTWYDQSGNGKHATQDTNTFQPKIYDGTNGIVKENDKPSLDFNGTDHYFDLDIYGFDDVSTFEVLSTSDAQWIGLNQQGNAYAYTYDAGSTSTALTQNFGTSPSLYVNSSLVATGNDTNRNVTYAATSDGNQKVISTVAASTALWTDSKWSGFSNWYFDGTLQELIVFDSDQTSNRSLIEDNINNYYLTYQVASTAPATGLLADHPAQAAYSVRQLGDALLCMKVASGAAGNPTKNIGFKNGVLDTAAIEEFCGNNDGFVATWYDQSGNAVDASQSTHSRRPKIYDNATGILKENNKPCVRQVDGTSQLQFDLSGNANQHYFGVVTSDVNNFLFTNDIASDQRFYLAGTDANGASASSNVTADDFYLNGTLSNGADDSRDSVYDAFINTQRLFSQKIDNSSWSSTQVFGYQFSLTYGMMDMQEVVIYNSDQSASRSSIEANINNHYKIYTPFIAGLLDSYPGPAAAYSLRRLSSTYTGPAIEITSTSGTQDIGFDSEGNLNTSDIIAFCNGNDGTVSKWYDQSGNGNDAVQATTANQPKIYDGTSGLIKDGNQIAVEFDSSSYLSSTTVTNTGEATAYVVANSDDTGFNKVILFVPELFAFLTNAEVLQLYSGITSEAPSGAITIIETNDTLVKNLIFFGNDGSTTFGGVNGQAFVTEANVPNSDTNYDRIKIGANATNTINFDGKIQEAVYYNSDQRSIRAGIEKNVNEYYEVFDQPLLDVVPDAAAAYSLRKLRAGYTGPAINVYNGTDYKDIYFKSDGTLDTGAISRFCGSNDGTVAIWYDQSGNNNHAEQNTAASRPKIYDGTTGLVTESGKPTISFDGTDDYLEVDGYIVELSQNSASVFAAANGGTPQAATDYLLSEGDATSPYSSNFILGGAGSGGSGVVLWVNETTFGTITDGQHVIGFDYDGTNFQAHLDGSTAGSSGTATVNAETAGGGTHIGSRADGTTSFYDGNIQEIITYKSDKSSDRPTAEANINHYYSIY